MSSTKTKVWLGVGGLVVVAAVVAATRPRAVPVELATVTRGAVRAVVTGTGKVRVRHRQVVAAPVAGTLSTITLRPGDRVEADQVVATVTSARSAPLDARSRGELEARIRAARAQREQAAATAERARVEVAHARREAERAAALASERTISEVELERALALARTSAWAERAAEAEVRAIAHALEVLEATLHPREATGAEAVAIRAPSAGVVLRAHRESAGPVNVGEPLLEVGDLDSIEVVVELLTADAVQVEPGAAAAVGHWGGAEALAARVRRVEPSAFTKISALGVEEQRVNVILDPVALSGTPGGSVEPTPESAAWRRLGDGFRVEADVIVAERSRALRVPIGAIVRKGGAFVAYAAREGRAALVTLDLGIRGEREVEVLAGLGEGEQVVLYPSEAIEAGVSVTPR